MELEQIVFIGGIVSYFLMRNQLRKVYSQEYIKSISSTFSIPILQIVLFTIFLYQAGNEAIKSAGKIDSLHNISTYTPFLGNLGKIADIANQSGLLPDIERSQETLEFIKAAGTANQYIGIGMLVVIALALAELYGVFRLRKFTKKQMQLFYVGISATFVICSFLLGAYMEKFISLLSSVFSGVDKDTPFSLIFPIIALLLWGLCYISYSKSLERLFSFQHNNEPEPIKQQNENKEQKQSSQQTAASSINPIEYSNTPTEENNPEFVTRDISSTNQQSEVIKSQDETITSSDIQESTLQTNENVCNDSIKVSGKKQSKFSYIGFAIGGIVIIIIAVFVVWQCIKDEDVMPTLQQAQQEKVNSTTGDTQQHSTQSISDIYEQRSNAIIQELTSKYGDKLIVDYKYPTLSRYCIFRVKGEYDSTDYLLIYDLEREVLKQLEHKKLQPSNGKEEIGVYSFDVSISSSNDKMFIFAFDGVRTQYLLELDFSNWNVKKLCVGSYIEQKGNHIIVHRDCLIKLKDCYSESEFANIDIYYDLQGKLIAPSYNGNTYYLKGLIDNKYAVTMQLSMQDNKIYGKYYYDKDGSDNELYLYGGVSDSGDVVLLEFNNKGEQTGDFKGRFTSDSFYGTFVNYKGIEMPFELQKDNHNVVPQELTLKKYHNSRFGYNVLYPSSFSNIYESENGDGCRFSKDSHTCLIVYGMHNVLNETIEDKYNEYRSKSPVYYRLKDNWFVVSDYTENGDIFYLKTVLKDGVFITAELHYPNNEKEYYSKLISKIFINFPN